MVETSDGPNDDDKAQELAAHRASEEHDAKSARYRDAYGGTPEEVGQRLRDDIVRFGEEPHRVTDADILAEAFKGYIDPSKPLSGRLICGPGAIKEIVTKCGGWPPDTLTSFITVVPSIEGALALNEEGKLLRSPPALAGPDA